MKKRLDILVTERGLAVSREQAKACIMAGEVYVNGQKEDKPGASFPDTAEIECRGEKLKYVSRGGLKLEKALQVFPADPSGKVCVDIGASTGGFTDCLLQNGAERVYAIDVGRGQLSWTLRNDSRVICMEKTNFRYLKPEDLPERPSFATADVSFISLSRILPPAFAVLEDRAEMICLIKPQFEAGRELVGKKGVVRDPAVHRAVIRQVLGYAEEQGFAVSGLDYSPIRGPEGNIEYLLYLVKGAGRSESTAPEEARAELPESRGESLSSESPGKPESPGSPGEPVRPGSPGESVIQETVQRAQEAFEPS